MKTSKKEDQEYLKIKCDNCGEFLNSSSDLILFRCDKETGIINKVTFRHILKCDDKDFGFSRHVGNGYDDILKEWEFSPFNYDGLNHPSNHKEKQKRLEKLIKNERCREVMSLMKGRYEH